MAALITLVVLLQVTTIVALSRIAISIHCKLERIIMTLQEAIQRLADDNIKLDDIGAKLTEGFTEITALIGQLQNTTLTPDQQAIVDALDSKVSSIQPQAQQIADIVPNPQP